MSGKEWMLNWLKDKINECCELEQQASDRGDYETSSKYSAVYFKLINKFITLGGVHKRPQSS